ncbi:MAG: hypothetical protein ACYC33_02310 [Thermoleophilia bacterium]
MLRRLFKLIVGMAGGAALAAYLRSDAGHNAVNRAAEMWREFGLDRRTPKGGGARPGTPAGEAAIEAKIEETRRRLREQVRQAEDGAAAEAGRLS